MYHSSPRSKPALPPAAKTGTMVIGPAHRNGRTVSVMSPTNGTATLTDPELVQQAKSGNLDAFGELVSRHERKMRMTSSPSQCSWQPQYQSS